MAAPWVAPIVHGATAPASPPTRRRVLIDADTANEVDDLYAIVRAFLEPTFTLVGLSAAQWNHRLSPPDTVLRSQRINEDLIRLLGRPDVPTPLGSEMIMGQPWGGTEPRDSPAAQLLIRAARETPPGEKLTVLCLGAVTNLASALALAPDIRPRLACYALGGQFYADRGVWDKSDFNFRNDLNAANYLFNAEGLELHVMPGNILFPQFRFTLEETRARLAGAGALWDYLLARWLTHAPAFDTWVMWDLALVLAVARPTLATEGLFRTPPENTQRDLWVYTAVDTEAMLADWWQMTAAAQAAGR